MSIYVSLEEPLREYVSDSLKVLASTPSDNSVTGEQRSFSFNFKIASLERDYEASTQIEIE